jgi:hypothetical protein
LVNSKGDIILEKIKALLLSNTDVNNLTVENFTESQKEMNNPVVIFCNMETTEFYNSFNIVAKDKEELASMYEDKVFFTSSVPKGKHEWHYGAVFYGVEPKNEGADGIENFEWLKQATFEMIEGVAKRRLDVLEDNDDIYESPECMEGQEALSKQYDIMKNKLQTDEERRMLLDFDTLASDRATMYGDSQFIQGFYEGINYLKKAIEAGLNKKERTAATDVLSSNAS